MPKLLKKFITMLLVVTCLFGTVGECLANSITNSETKETVDQKDEEVAITKAIAEEIITDNINIIHENVVYNIGINQILYNYEEVENISVDINGVLYLSDIPYVSGKTFTNYGSIVYDKTSANTKISLRYEGNLFTFDKGIWAHATSEIVYDLRNYPGYAYLTTFVGINSTASTNGNGVKFHFYTSDDGENWELKNEVSPQVMKSNINALFYKIDIKGANFIKLRAYDNGGNGNDHSVFADAKLITEDYEENDIEIKSVTKYDTELKAKYNNAALNDTDYELLLLQRKFVDSVGQYTLTRFISENDDNKAVFEWLFNDVDNLREYILGGTPAGGSYYNALNVLSSLYKNYKTDLDNKNLLNNKWDPSLTYSDLYRKMMFAISLTHSQTVGLWMQSNPAENRSDPIRRYAIYRYLHKNGKFVVTSTIDKTPWFEYLRVEEMRFIMNNSIDDEEILWLNAYVQSKIDAAPNRAESLLTPHSYIAYVWPNYTNSVYYDAANVDYFNELFAIPAGSDSTQKIGMFDVSFTIPGGVDVPEYTLKITRGTPEYKLYKVWMNFRNKFGTGAVCGGISKSGSNIRATHGIPATVIGQPGHAAILYYTKNTSGKGYWGIDNDVSGWTKSEKGERMLLGWGNETYQRGYSVVYMILAQEAINDYDNLVKAEEYVMLAKAYQGDLNKQEELYKEALRLQPINIDAWYGLIQTFNANSAKTEKDYYELASDIATNLMPFPLPMYHLTNLIKPKLTSIEYAYQFTLLQTRTLTAGSVLQNGTDLVLQPSVTRTEASYLLGLLDKTIATFSFDGNDAGKIVLSSRFDGAGVRWDYSLDGKQSWKEVSFTGEEEHKLELTKEELESITAENDIYVHIVGVNYDEENLYKIDITKATNPSNLYANDLENRVVGATLTMEWRYTQGDEWTSYKEASPNLTGNTTVEVRVGSNGTSLASDSLTFGFTEDNQSETRKYIPVSHLSISAVSSQATSNQGSATYAIDANYNTRWHSAWNGTDTQRYITIKLDSPVYLSAVEFVPGGGGNGKIYDGTIYGSLDGVTWTKLAEQKNLTYTNQANTIEDAITNIKSFEIPIENQEEPVQYVKIVADRTNGNWFVARAFNFYRDATKEALPIVSIGYSTILPTNGEVIARLTNYDGLTITNGSDTYTFTENGKHVFEFIDKNGTTGTATAIVDWIDKDAPTAKVNYISSDSEVRAILSNISENVYILDEENNPIYYIEVEDDRVVNITYLDDNGKITKEVELDEEGFTKTINYYNEYENVIYITEFDRGGNIVGETFLDEYGNIVTNPTNINELRALNQISRINPLEYAFTDNFSYAFKIQDIAGNITIIEADANFLDKEAPTAIIIYSTVEKTNTEVIATLLPNKEVTITNNNGNNTYTFTKNGEFTFEFVDEAGNVGRAIAKVDWIDKTAPTATLNYDKSSKTKAIVKVVNPSEEIIFKYGNGIYTFTKNGVYEIIFYDKAGNMCVLKAVVDWLEENRIDDNNQNSNDSNSNENNSGNQSSNNQNNTTNNSGNQSNNNQNSTTNNSGNQSSNNQNSTTNNSGNQSNNNQNNTVNNNNTNNSNNDLENIGSNNSNNQNNTVNNDTNNNQSNISNDTIDDSSNSIDKDVSDDEKYKSFTCGSIIIKGLKKDLSKVSKIEINNITLTSDLQKEFGNESEIIELYFVDENSRKVSIETDLTITMSLNTKKEFEAIYMLKNGTLRELSYTKLSNNKIEFKASSLEKIVIKYNEKKVSDSETEVKVKSEVEEKNTNIIKFIVIAIVVLSGVIVIIYKKNK